MKTLFVALVSLSMLSGLALAGDDEANKCKAGKEFNPDTGKCETIRGS